MITIHTPIISTHTSDIKAFINEIVENPHVCDKENVLVQFEEGKAVHILPLKDLPNCFWKKDGDTSVMCYDGLTGIKAYGGTGIALLSPGRKTDIFCFNKTEITRWVKANWTDGVLIDWAEVKGHDVEKSEKAITATRLSYDWR